MEIAWSMAGVSIVPCLATTKYKKREREVSVNCEERKGTIQGWL